MRHDVPVGPDDEEARRWLEEELGRGDEVYTEPETPQWLQDLLDWLRDLLGSSDVEVPTTGADTGGTVGIILAVVLVVAALVVAFAIFGLPRLRRRSAVTGELFGEDDDRSSREIRSAAQQAADAGDFTAAVVEVFRSLARDLAERGIVIAFPGTTAREFGRSAGEVFPAAAERLQDAAQVFDGVRYLGRTGTEEQWQRMSALTAELRAAKSPRGPRAADALDAAAERALTEEAAG
ncbi:DUF4129 domain-containing protein [Pseudolysinimonas sp.]|jgi:hypothetical protein|uniref:DUF4129 domain-containing protein n=1 Tax=Pseudolysinimonas sp. TaxID=2680009 RepID=UPI0037835B4D